MTEQEYKEICEEVKNSGIPVPSQKKIIDALKEKPKCEDCAGCTVWKCDCANIRSKAIDDFFEELQKYEDNDMWLRLKISSIYEIAEQLKVRSD